MQLDFLEIENICELLQIHLMEIFSELTVILTQYFFRLFYY